MIDFSILTAQDRGNIESLLEYIALDENDVAINGACYCNFCLEYIADINRHADHHENCLFVAARRVLGFPINREPAPEEGEQ